MEARSSVIPNYIKAANPLGLRRLMLLTATKLNAQLKFFDIQYVVDGKEKYWIAWYCHDVLNDDQIFVEQTKAGGS